MRNKKIGVVRFPGTNCDQDIVHFVESHGFAAKYLWYDHQEELSSFEAIIVPGGFSFGDYLRAGAMASRTPVMKSVENFAKKGGPVLGICNGFQILTEAGLLPGALIRNENLRFIDDWVELVPVNESGYFFRSKRKGDKIHETGKTHEMDKIRLPIAHGEGRFYASDEEMKRLEDQGQVWFRYVKNPNGSLSDIAGVLNRNKNVAGLMPHPERALYDWMGGTDGWSFL